MMEFYARLLSKKKSKKELKREAQMRTQEGLRVQNKFNSKFKK